MFSLLRLGALPFFRRLFMVLVRWVDTLSPTLALRLAERAFRVPVRLAPRGAERDVLRSARREWVEFAGRRVALWRWGSGPAVLLAHGWSGHGGQLAAFVEPLVSTGFTVLAWDAPAHGRSEGRRTSPLEFVELLGLLARRERRVHAVIGHSLGAGAAALACADGAPIERVVFMGGAANPGGFFRWYLGALGFSDVRRAAAMIEIEREHGFRWDDTNVAVRVAGLARVRALVVHDRTDYEVPFAEGRRVADNWPGARFLATEGLGHRRIVRDARVVGEAMRFLVEGTGLAYRSEAETVEFDLWHRHARSGPYEIRRRVAAAGRVS